MSQHINLYEASFRPSRRSPTSAGVLAPAVVAVAVAVLAWWAWERNEVRALREAAARVDAELKAQQARQATLMAEAAARRTDPRLAAEVERLEGQLGARRENLATLRSGAVGDTTGFSGHMLGLARQSMDGLWLTGFSIGGADTGLTLAGRTLDAGHVPAWLKRLAREQAFNGRSFGSLVIARPKPDPKQDPKQVAAPPWLEFSLSSEAAAGAAARGAGAGR